MKVLLVNGSPHEKGCTNMALSRPERAPISLASRRATAA